MWQSDMRSWVEFTHWAAHVLGLWRYSWDFYKKTKQTNHKNKEKAAISVPQIAMKPYRRAADMAAEGKSIAGYFWEGRYSIQVQPIIHSECPRVLFSGLTRPCNFAATVLEKRPFCSNTIDGPLLSFHQRVLTLSVATSRPSPKETEMSPLLFVNTDGVQEDGHHGMKMKRWAIIYTEMDKLSIRPSIYFQYPLLPALRIIGVCRNRSHNNHSHSHAHPRTV